MSFFSKNVRPALVAVFFVALPVLVINFVSTLPEGDPNIPDYFKAQGFSSVDGAKLEKLLQSDNSFSSNLDPIVVACPSTTVLSTSQPAYCGYCKSSNVEVYPFWLDGFSARLHTAQYDYRSFYVDHIHRRFFSLTHGQYAVFTRSAALGHWNQGDGAWFKCHDSNLVDINAYVQVFRDWNAKNDLHVRYRILDYKTLNPVVDQAQAKIPSPRPTNQG